VAAAGLASGGAAALGRATPAATAERGPEPFASEGPGEPFDLAIDDRPLALGPLAPGQVAFNPSLVPYGKGALLAFRLDTATGDPRRPDMRIAVVPLDANFAPTAEPVVLDLRPPGHALHTAEDPRLLWMGRELYLLFNQRPQEGRSRLRRMYVARLALAARGTGPALRVARLAQVMPPAGFKLGAIEKNWAPFVAEGTLWLLYGSNPPVALGVDPAGLASGGANVETFGPVAAARAVSFDHGAWRGGTPATPTGTEGDGGPLEAIFHLRGRRGDKVVYGLGYYTFAPAPPFAIERVLPAPLVVPDLEDDSPAKLACAFPGGLLRRGERLYVAYGRHDRAVHLLTLDAPALERALVAAPPPQEGDPRGP
jgi:hypothetical protein